MNSAMKGIIIMAVILYIVSPIDIAPGPIDDLIVLLLGIAASKKISTDNNSKGEARNEKENSSYYGIGSYTRAFSVR